LPPDIDLPFNGLHPFGVAVGGSGYMLQPFATRGSRHIVGVRDGIDHTERVPPEIELKHMYTGIWPFIALQALATALVVAFPQTVLWLPNAMR